MKPGVRNNAGSLSWGNEKGHIFDNEHDFNMDQRVRLHSKAGSSGSHMAKIKANSFFKSPEYDAYANPAIANPAMREKLKQGAIRIAAGDTTNPYA